MAILVTYEIAEMDTVKYDEAIRRLVGAGADERTYHVCYGDRQNLQVMDVFESQAKFDAYMEKLTPILQAVGIEGKITVHEVYNRLLWVVSMTCPIRAWRRMGSPWHIMSPPGSGNQAGGATHRNQQPVP